MDGERGGFFKRMRARGSVRWQAFRAAYPDGDHWRLLAAGILIILTLSAVAVMLRIDEPDSTVFNTTLLGLVFVSALIGACQSLRRMPWLIFITAVALCSWYLSVKSSVLVDCTPINSEMAEEARLR